MKEKWMSKALALAEKGAGSVWPNPLVGAVIVKDGVCIGEGYHAEFGGAHAEICALASATESVQGAVMYVTLEPCAHTGKTPPCTDALIQAGIRKVYVAMRDPNPVVSGKGVEALRNSGIEVEIGLLGEIAGALNTGYLHWLKYKRPKVRAKYAMTLDGNLATCNGDAFWISNEVSRRHAHGLRSEASAVVVGVGTVLMDNPALTVRYGAMGKQPHRVVVDPSAKTPEDALMFEVKGGPVHIFTSVDAPVENRRALERKGAQVHVLEPLTVHTLLKALVKLRLEKVLVEGGGKTHGAFFREGYVDDLSVYIAPKLLLGAGVSPIAGETVAQVAHALPLASCEVLQLAGDVIVQGHIEEATCLQD